MADIARELAWVPRIAPHLPLARMLHQNYRGTAFLDNYAEGPMTQFRYDANGQRTVTGHHENRDIGLSYVNWGFVFPVKLLPIHLKAFWMILMRSSPASGLWNDPWGLCKQRRNSPRICCSLPLSP